MGENFSKLKSRALKIRLLKSVLAGVAVGLLCAGILLLLSKFEMLAFTPILALAIGAAVILLMGTAVYFLLYTSDKTLAKRLDRQYRLNEKVQTMLAYKDKEGIMYELQREDADASLAAVPKKSISFKRLWIYILCFMIGAAVFTASFVLSPEETPPPVVPDEPFAITELQIAALEELIKHVETSEMASPYRENVAQSLYDLLDELKLATTESEKDASLSKAMDAIYEQTGLSSSALELMNALWSYDADSTKQLAKALNYYEWPTANAWEKFSGDITDVRTELALVNSVTETQVLFIKVSSNITEALTKSKIEPTDPLCTVLTRLATANETKEDGTRVYGLSTLSALSETLGATDTQRELDATFTALNSELFGALSQHAENTGTGEYAMTRLSELFGCQLPKFERPQFYESSSGDSSGSSGSDEGGGGAIGGGAVYGSDDMVFDPYTNQYVEYGTILDKYYALMFGKLQDSDYTDEEKAAMEKYFDILYGGFDQEDEE